MVDSDDASSQNLTMQNVDEKIIIKVKFQYEFLKFESCLLSGAQNVFNELQD